MEQYVEMLVNLLYQPVYVIAGLLGLAVLSLLLFILLIVALVKIGNLKKKYNAFMGGSEAKSLEELIQQEVADIQKLKENDQNMEERMDIMDKVISGCYQKTGVAKYDALTGMGGQVSFALAMLDQKNCGIIINSSHTREGSYLYMKEIKNGTCEILLGKEEQKALDAAMAV